MLRDTKWFYERTRGQYLDAQAKLTPGKKKRFQAEFPPKQVFTKTDLAKYENVWDDHPRWVNLGAQKNFVRFAEQISEKWEKTQEFFDESYFKRLVARTVLFRFTEVMVQQQPWYQGGYRANIVAYTLALISETCKKNGRVLDFGEIWKTQTVAKELQHCLIIAAEFANEGITSPPEGISNLSEWAKKEACWQQMQKYIPALTKKLPDVFFKRLTHPA